MHALCTKLLTPHRKRRKYDCFKWIANIILIVNSSTIDFTKCATDTRMLKHFTHNRFSSILTIQQWYIVCIQLNLNDYSLYCDETVCSAQLQRKWKESKRMWGKLKQLSREWCVEKKDIMHNLISEQNVEDSWGLIMKCCHDLNSSHWFNHRQIIDASVFNVVNKD